MSIWVPGAEITRTALEKTGNNSKNTRPRFCRGKYWHLIETWFCFPEPRLSDVIGVVAMGLVSLIYGHRSLAYSCFKTALKCITVVKKINPTYENSKSSTYQFLGLSLQYSLYLSINQSFLSSPQDLFFAHLIIKKEWRGDGKEEGESGRERKRKEY